MANIITQRHREDPNKDKASSLTEKLPGAKDGYHPIRTPTSSQAYKDGWDRIWKKRRAKPPVTAAQAESFWRLVSPEPNTGCWLWLGATAACGRGLRYGTIGGSQTVNGHRLAHRVSWELHRGEPPNGVVCHRCDNPLCVNPAHLFLGTQRDNLRDMARKERNATKLNGDAVRRILCDVKAGESKSAIARRFGISRRMVRRIELGTTWRHVTSA